MSISLPMRGGGAGEYYLKLAREEYYTKSLGPPGQWFGKGAEALGLSGEVKPEQLKNLLEGKSPDGDRNLVQVQQWKDRERQSGWDITFSAPKPVSVLWSQSDAQVQKTIEKCHDLATRKSLSFLEENAAITRRGEGGRIHEKASVVWAIFQHGTSRANDPQLHSHAVLINVAVREDGSTGALQSREFFKLKMAAGAIYQLELANQLREKLNLKIVHEKVGFHIEGVPKELCKEFSKRRQQIEKVIQREGDSSAKASRRAAEITRPAKHESSREQLFAQWQETGRAHGWGPEQARELLQNAAKQTHHEGKKTQTLKPQKPSPHTDKSGKRDYERAVTALLQQAQEKQSTTDEFIRAEESLRTKPFIRIERRWMFPHASERSPFKNWTRPVLVVGDDKVKDWWGKVHWEVKTPLGHLQFRNKYLFPNAWELNPFKNFAVPRLVLRQDTQWKWREVIWKKNTIFGQAQIRWKALFPHAVENSLAHRLAIPAFRLQTRRPELKTNHEQNQSNQKHHEHEKTMSH